MIRVSDLRFAHGGKMIFDGFSGTFGRATCITGPSGVGKTTLLRLLAGLEKPQSGTITGIPRRVTMLFQEDRLLPWLTAKQNVAAVLPPKDADTAEEWLRTVELQDDMDSCPDSLSGGQKRRVALARALAYNGGDPAGLLVLDEPFNGFDPALTGRMASLILAQNVPMIAAVHSPEEMALLGGEIIRLSE